MRRPIGFDVLRRWRGIALAVGAVMFGIGTAMATEDDIIPKPDPKGWWRVIHVDDARSTTNCIGNPITPLCVAETWMGCFIRRDGKLCEMVDPKYAEYGRPFGGRARPSITRYRVLSADRLTRKSMPAPTYENDSTHWRPGDIRIMILSDRCAVFTNGELCYSGATTLEPEGFIVRKIDDKWILVSTVSPPRI